MTFDKLDVHAKLKSTYKRASEIKLSEFLSNPKVEEVKKEK